MNLYYHVFSSLEELTPYADRWNELVQNSPSSSIFLTWEWFSTWCICLGNHRPLFIIAVFDKSDNLLAILPLYQSNLKLFKCITYHCLRLAGDCFCGGEYPDLIVDSDANVIEIQRCIRTCLYKHKFQWDWLYFTHVSGWNEARSRLSLLDSEHASFIRQRQFIFSTIFLPLTLVEYECKILGSFASLIRRQQKKIEKIGNLSIQICNESSEIPIYLNNLFRLHRKRWESTGQRGSFDRRPLTKCFYEAFATIALDKGWLKIFSLQVDNKVLAVQIGYLFNDVFYQMQEGFDPEGPGGLGNVLRLSVIKWCINNNVREYDYLGGDDKHKLRWGAKQRNGFFLFSGRKNLKNSFMALAEIWPSGRFISSEPFL